VYELAFEEEDRLIQDAKQAIRVFPVPLGFGRQPKAAPSVRKEVSVGFAGESAHALVDAGLLVGIIVGELDTRLDPSRYTRLGADHDRPIEFGYTPIIVHSVVETGVMFGHERLVVRETSASVPLVPGALTPTR
jgi:hypothetical protein